MSTAAAGRIHDPRVQHHDGALTVASLAMIDPVALHRAGCRTLALTEPVGLGDSDEFDVRFLRLLREAMSVILRVSWTAARVPFDLSTVYHLPPPRPQSSTSDRGTVEQWRRRHRFGLCYYRVGPGFVLLRDTREDGARYRLDDPAAVAAWPELEAVVRLPDAAPGTRALCELLDGERLVLRRGEWATLLPFRMRQWPVPFDAV